MNQEQNKFVGLTSNEVKQRLKEHGENIVAKKKRLGPVLIFLSKFKNPLLLLLVVISTVSFLVGQRASAVIVLMMVFLAVILDFINSYRSQIVVEKLIAKVATKVTIIRDNYKNEIEIKDIVPGDIVLLSAGNMIPADCIVREADDFFINQAALTGESIPIEKIATTNDIDEKIKISTDNNNFIFMGTNVVSGFATAEVLQTGTRTEFGKIAKDLTKAKPKTDFEESLSKFSVFIIKVVFYMISFVFVVYLLKNASHLNRNIIIETFTFALAIAIGVTPDMLPTIIAVCLSKGSQLMAKKKVIVKHLSSIENFGSMDVLCTDKTGTLTKDHIELVKCLDVAGKESKNVFELGYLSSYFHTGVKSPLDDAIKEHDKLDIKKYEKIDEIPYDFIRKKSSMVVKKNNKRILITKGAPEEILKICSFYEYEEKIIEIKNKLDTITKQFVDLSWDGFRVLALCYKELPDDNQRVYNKVVENNLIFIGYMAFLDPPKQSVKPTIIELEKLGIELKILTGDNDLLAQKICRNIGIKITGVVTGQEIEKMSDSELEKKVVEYNIFARVTPNQKEKIILILKKIGKTVGFLGDGINDAPALKAADVGISVNNAVEIAKDTADIILLEKNLETLKDGVVEGRKTFHNTKKYILMGLSSNFGNMFSMMGASIFLPFLPMLPAQVLFNNFIYDASQMTLPTDSVDADELLRPAHWDFKFIRSYMIVFGWMSSIFDFLTFYLLFFVFHFGEHAFQNGWFIESIATQIFVIYIIRTKK
ncbi:MAG: magnesium-translocating P-type ATPase, partial [Candidatus Falkowbacteria bacterium]|nr:magnesium-translocating P-type ATPase [Candidatus Falkowbacteria bacterium]